MNFRLPEQVLKDLAELQDRTGKDKTHLVCQSIGLYHDTVVLPQKGLPQAHTAPALPKKATHLEVLPALHKESVSNEQFSDEQPLLSQEKQQGNSWLPRALFAVIEAVKLERKRLQKRGF